MKKRMLELICVVLGVIGNFALAGENTAEMVLHRSAEKYRTIESYSDEGTVLCVMDAGSIKTKMETKFSMKMKKPNLYLISWTENANQGVACSNGCQSYIYRENEKSCTKMKDHRMAIAYAAGLSGAGGTSYTIPSLFLEIFGKDASCFEKFSDAKLEDSAKIGEEDCYVVSGNLKNSAITGETEDSESSKVSAKMTLCISKNSFFILKKQLLISNTWVCSQGAGETINGSGEKITAENKEALRDTVKQSRTSVIEITEMHYKISTQILNKKDFDFDIPDGTAFKENSLGTKWEWKTLN